MIERVDDLAAIASEWASCWDRSSATVFQRPEWLVPWWRHLGEGSLRVFAAREDGDLVGILPLYDNPNGVTYPLGVATSDYLGGVCARPEVARALLARLAEDLPGPCEISQLPPGSPWVDAPWPGAEVVDAGEPCRLLALPAALSAKIRRNLRYYESRAGATSLEVARDRVEPWIERLFAWSAARWGEEGVLADPRLRDLVADAVPALARAGRVRVYGLSVRGRPAAMILGLVDRTVRGWLSARDPELRDLSPGTLALGGALRAAEAEGFPCWDLLRGEERYKALWGSEVTPTIRRRLVAD